MSLNEEIRQLLNSYSLPAEAGRQMSEAMARLDANRVAPGLEVGEKAADFRLPDIAGPRRIFRRTVEPGPGCPHLLPRRLVSCLQPAAAGPAESLAGHSFIGRFGDRRGAG